MISRKNILFSSIVTFILGFVYLIPLLNLFGNYILLPWDGYLYSDYLEIINNEKDAIKSIYFFLDFPEYYFSKLLNKIIGLGEYFTRIILIFPSAFIVSLYFHGKFLENKSILNRVISGVIIVILFINIPLQILINNGVMYRSINQILYFLFLLILINVLVRYRRSKDNIILISIIPLLILISIWSYNFILVIAIFIFCILIELLYKNYKYFIRINFIKSYLLLQIILLFFLVLCMYYSVATENLSLIYGYNSDNNNLLNGATYNQLKGGILFPILGYSDWTQYTDIGSKIVGTMDYFYEYNIPQSIALFNLLVIIFAILFFRRYNNFFYIFPFIILALYFSKGFQPPFGIAYKYLVDNFVLFQSIRTPDTKFGIFLAATILVMVAKILADFNNKTLLKCIIFIYISFSFILIKPIVRGETQFGFFNTNNSNYSYIINPKLDQSLFDIISEFESGGSKGLLLPGIGFAGTPSGVIGFRDYLLPMFSSLISFVNSDKGICGSLLSNGISLDAGERTFIEYLNCKNINFVVIRKTVVKDMPQICLECVRNSSSFDIVYEDNFTLVIKLLDPNFFSHNINDFSNKQIFLIKILRSIALFISLLIILFSIAFYFLNTRKKYL